VGLKRGSFLLLVVLFSCGSSTYKYYGLDVAAVEDVERGALRGPEAKDDLPLTECLPRRGKASPCVAMRSEEFSRAMRDLAALRERLKACESAQ
jgi:hypothetical protein